MRSNLSVIFGVICIVGAATLFIMKGKFFQPNSTLVKEQLKTSKPVRGSTDSLRTVLAKVVKPKPSAIEASTYQGAKKDIEIKVAIKQRKSDVHRGNDYFRSVIKDEQLRTLFQHSKNFLGTSQAGEGAARWITLGGLFSSSDGYSDALLTALKDANSNPEEVFQNLNQNINVVRKDPFIYQMSMNMVYQLNLDVNTRADFFGREFEFQLKNSGNQQPKEGFWVALMGLTLAKQMGVKGEMIEPSIRRGIADFQGADKLKQEVIKTVHFHFPEMRL